MRVSTLVVVALMLVVPGCADPVRAESDILYAGVAGLRLELTNRTDDPVYYFAVDNETAAVIDWGPCTDPGQCVSVPSRSTKRIPLSDLHIREGATHLVVFHWQLVPRGGQPGFVFDSVRTLMVDLP